MADLLTSAQAAEILGKSVWVINYRARIGALPFEQKLPGETGAYLFSREVIEAAKERLTA